MRKIFVMLAVVFSAAFGTVLVAAENSMQNLAEKLSGLSEKMATPNEEVIPSELTVTQQLALKHAFCQQLGCGRNAVLSRSPHCVVDYKKWKFLEREAWDNLKKRPDFVYDSQLEDKFLKDLEKAQVLDGFVFTKKHTQDCLSDWEAIFKDNYTPTFNIELLK